jgi:hypothetical protein
MTHIHEKTGKKFDVGRLFDSDGRTYDINVILKWDEENDFEQSPVIIDYYLGDYDKESTDSYIEQFLKNQEHLKNAVKYLENKYTVDYDFMKASERLKLTETIKALKEMITTIV